MSERTFLFEYAYKGEVYGLTIVAADEFDAVRRLIAAQAGKLVGEVGAVLPYVEPKPAANA